MLNQPKILNFMLIYLIMSNEEKLEIVMKKLTALVLTLILVSTCVFPASAALVGKYTDHTNGNVLTLPSGWTYKSKSADYASISFQSNSSESAYMTYESIDVYSGFDASIQSTYTRSEICNDLFTKEDIASVIGVDASDITMVTINGIEYFYADSVYTTTSNGSRVSVDDDYWVLMDNGWFYCYNFAGDTDGQLYKNFKAMIASATYGAAESSTNGSSSDYEMAVTMYNNGFYSIAKGMFERLGNYKNSQDYLRLLRIRSYGRNVGIGCVYDYRKALTDSEKADIDKAAQNFYFADTAEVLMSNTDVATYYLFGRWVTANNAPQYAYLQFHKDSVGGYYYTRSTNLSNAISDCVSINDGYVRVSITSSNTLVFHIKLTGPDSMSLYCYEYDRCVELYRQ